MTTYAPPRLTPALAELFKAMRDIEATHHTPTEHGDVGKYKSQLAAFVETLAESYESYQEEVKRFLDDPEHGYEQAMHTTYYRDSGQEQKEPKPKTLVNFAELRHRPRPQWVIEGYMYENTIVELYAEAGCYKSFLAFDWSARIATGTNWLGCVKTHKKGVVVYIAAEGADGYIARGDAWCKHNNIPFDTLCENFYFWPEPLPLGNSAEIARFIEEVTDTLKASGQTPAIVVIDTLLRCSDGANINAPDVMGTIFEGANRIKTALNIPNILIVHHAGKNAQLGGMGSVVLKNDCDCVYFMSKDASVSGQVILKAEKMKDKPELTIYLRSEKVYYTDDMNEDESSLVIVAGERPCKEKAAPKLPKSQQDLLVILDAHTTLAYGEWFKLYEQNNGKKPTFDKARAALLDNKTIEEHEGKYRRYQEPQPSQEKENDEDND